MRLSTNMQRMEWPYPRCVQVMGVWCTLLDVLIVRTFVIQLLIIHGLRIGSNTWVLATQPNTQKGSQANHFTQKQKYVRQSILTNFGFTSSSLPVTLNDFENPSLARLCLGLPIIEGSIEHDMLLNVPFRSDHEFVPLFRPIPLSVTAKQGTNAEGKVVGNAYKSIHCPETSVTPNRPFANHICIFCSNVPHLQQFKREREKRIVGMNKSRMWMIM